MLVRKVFSAATAHFLLCVIYVGKTICLNDSDGDTPVVDCDRHKGF